MLKYLTAVLFLSSGICASANASMFIGDTASVTFSGVRSGAGVSYTFDVYSPSLIYVYAGFAGSGLGNIPAFPSPTASCYGSVSGSYNFAGLSGGRLAELNCPGGNCTCSLNGVEYGSLSGEVRLDPGTYGLSIDASTYGYDTATPQN